VDETTVVFSGSTKESRRSLPSIEQSVLAVQQSNARSLFVDSVRSFDSVRSVEIICEPYSDVDGGPGTGRWDGNQ
jgi:hypothetical protein